jgi:ATP-dependent DNA ligase
MRLIYSSWTALDMRDRPLLERKVEYVVSKKIDSLYCAGRQSAWVKSK